MPKGFIIKGGYSKCKFAKLKLRKIHPRYGKNSIQYKIARRIYTKILKSEKNNFLKGQCQNLSKLELSDPREHWKLLKSGFSKNTLCEVSLQQWFDHFERLFSADESNTSNYVQPLESDHNNEQIHIQELDKPISRTELRVCILYFLKYNKACGIDGVYNDFIKWAMDWISPILLNIFNAALKMETTPESWSQEILIPIFKKSGSTKEPNNYRGIALLSSIGKLFGVILNNRLYKWAEENHKLCSFQGGFRRKRSCTDQCFILLSVTQIQFHLHQKTYACFVDFQKAYDSVQHHLLWQRLRQAGISSKSLNILKSLYKNVIGMVKTHEGLSTAFKIQIGVRQGCVLSPLLFNLYINEIEAIFVSKNFKAKGISIGELVIFALLYADDLVLVADSQEELQQMIIQLENFCEQSKLIVNLKKTQELIFRKRNSADIQPLYYKNSMIGMQDEYVYLGTIFSAKGTFVAAAKQAVNKARAAEILFWKYIRNFKFLSVSAILKKFNVLVIPVLLYNCEIWGPMITELQMESIVGTFYRKCLRRILGVNQSAPNSTVYSILGCFPISIQITIKVLNFFVAIMTIKEKANCKTAMLKIFDIKNNYWSYLKKNLPEHLLNTNFNL